MDYLDAVAAERAAADRRIAAANQLKKQTRSDDSSANEPDQQPPNGNMADPFQVRVRFSSQLQNLNASVTSAQKAAAYAIKYKDMDEDLHSCILEQLEKVSSATRDVGILRVRLMRRRADELPRRKLPSTQRPTSCISSSISSSWRRRRGTSTTSG